MLPLFQDRKFSMRTWVQSLSYVLCVSFLCGLMKPKASFAQRLVFKFFLRTGEQGFRWEMRIEQHGGRKSSKQDSFVSEKFRQKRPSGSQEFIFVKRQPSPVCSSVTRSSFFCLSFFFIYFYFYFIFFIFVNIGRCLLLFGRSIVALLHIIDLHIQEYFWSHTCSLILI